MQYAAQLDPARTMQCRAALAMILLLTNVLASCGGGSSGVAASSPPVISNLSYSPHNVTQNPGGTATFGGRFDFTDSGGDLSTVTLVATDQLGVVVGSGTSTIQVASGQKSGTVQASVTIKVDTAGLYSFKVSVADQGGAKSNELQGTFRVAVAANLATVVASTQPSPRELKAAGGYLYWSESGANVIKRVPVGGGTITGLAPKVINPSPAVFVGSDVLWMDQGGNGTPCGVARSVNRTNPAGVTQQLALESSCATQYSTDFVADGTNTYWIASTQSPDTYQIRAMPLNGGPITTLATASNPVVNLKANGTAVFWQERTTLNMTGWIRSVPAAGGSVTTVVDGFLRATDDFAVDANAVYFAQTVSIVGSPQTISLMAQPLAGGSLVTLARDISQPIVLASDGTTLVWADTVGLGLPNATHVNAIPVGGGTVAVLATLSTYPVSIMIDGTNVVWSDRDYLNRVRPTIQSVPFAGGAATLLYQGPDPAGALRLDGSGQICWTEAANLAPPDGSGRIARLLPSASSQTLVSGVYGDSPTFIVAGSDLVVADISRVKRVPLGGGMIETIAISPAPFPNLASDGATVYFDAGGAVYSVPIAGGAMTQVAAAPAGMTQGGPIRLAPNGNLYWVVNGENIAFVSAVGGTPTVVTVGPVSSLAVDSTGVYFGSLTYPGISVLPLDGGTPVGLTMNNLMSGGSVSDIAIDGGKVYWIDGGQIGVVPVAGGDTDALVGFTSAVATSWLTSNLALDSGHLYWSEPLPQTIRSAPR